jgi:DNA primase
MIDFVRKVNHVSFNEALDFLVGQAVYSRTARPTVAKRQKPPAKRCELTTLCEIARDNLWSEKGDRARDYLEARGFTSTVVSDYSLGLWPFSPREGERNSWTERIIFPYVRPNGSVWAMSGRRIVERDDPKYLFSGAPEIYLGGFVEGRDPSTIFITEGVIDALSIITVFPGETVIAVNGSMVSALKAVPLAGVKVFAVTDNDLAGNEIFRRVGQILTPQGATVKRVAVPEGYNDVNDVLRHSPALLKHWLIGATQSKRVARVLI